MPPKVTKIPARINFNTRMPEYSAQKRRVAAYARVSTDSEEQLTSYEAQVDYYTKYIKNRNDWQFVDVYTDEGVSATNTRHRDGFNRMIEDALTGSIDLIITKSVSRFARNTVDSLTTIRKLKEHNIEVYFEKEGIWTFDSKGEILITIMSSLSQEESRSISENVTWGQRKRMADGKISLPYGHFLGYRKGDDGLPEIIPEEAAVVRSIYKMFMQGMTPGKIAKELMSQKILSPSGKERWHSSTVQSILTNEKYKGSAILQKKFTVDFLTKKTKVNEGEVPQYIVENSHPAIIPPEEFELVQAEILRRKEIGSSYSGSSPFSSKILCSCCGGYFGAKVWHSTSKYRRTIWQCNHKFQNGTKCTTPHVSEDEVKLKFLEAVRDVMKDRELFIESCGQISEILSDTSAFEEKIEKIYAEIQQEQVVLSALIQKNASEPLNQDEFRQTCKPHEDRLNELNQDLKSTQQKIEKRNRRKESVDIIIERISRGEVIYKTFDDDSFKQLVENITVHENGKLTFRFLNGTEIEK